MKKIILIILISIVTISCRKPTIAEIIQTAQWSVDEACSVEWLNKDQCSRFNTSMTVAKSFLFPGNPEQQRFALKQFFENEIRLLSSEDSKLIPYYQWAVDFLGVVDTKVTVP